MALQSAVKAGRAFVEIFADDSRLVAGLRRAQARLRAFGASATRIGRSFFTAAIGGGALFGLTAKIFTSFSDQMLKVKAISGATGQAFEDLTERAKELGRTTSFTASQVASAMVELSRAGFEPDQILATIDSVLDLSRATNTDLARATEIAAQTLKQFNLEASESKRVVDVLTKTVNSSTQVLDDMAESMKFVAPLANEAGESLEDTAAAIGILADNGIKGSAAGTQLARAYKNLADEAKRANLKETLGIDVGIQGDFRKMSDILEDIGNKTKNLGNIARISAFEELFGRGAVAAIKLGTAGAKFDDMAKKIRNSSNAAREAAQVMDEGIGGAFRRMLSAVEGLALAIGDAIKGPLIRMAEKIQKLSGILANVIDKNKKFVVAIFALNIALGAIGAALIVFGFAAQGAAAAIGVLIGTLALLKVSFLFLLSPIVAMGIMIGVFAVGVIRHFGKVGAITDWLKDKFNILKSDALKAFEGIKAAISAGDIGQAAKILWLTVLVEWRRGINAINQVWQEWKTFFLQIANSVMDQLATIFINAWAGIRNIFAETIGFFSSAWNKFVASFRKNILKITGEFFKLGVTLSLTLSEVEKAGQKRAIDQIMADTRKKIEEGSAIKLGGIEEDVARRIANIEAERKGAREALGESNVAAEAGIFANQAQALKDSSDALDDAVMEWRGAILLAKRNATKQEQNVADAANITDQERENESNRNAALGQLKDAKVTGTFSPFAIRGLLTSGTEARSLKAAESTARSTARMEELIGKQLQRSLRGPTFVGHSGAQA